MPGPLPAAAGPGAAGDPPTTPAAPTAERLPLRTPAQAARLLAVRESWLRRKAAARVIPCTFLGKHLRFSPADLTAIATAGGCPGRTRTPAVHHSRHSPRHRSRRDR